jgi:hypothetical protein
MTLPLGITRSLGPTKAELCFQTSVLHLCSNCHSYSLASFCPYTLHWITVQLNLPYAHLRYLLEGYRPSQTNTVTRSRFPLSRMYGEWISLSGWYFTDAFWAPTYATQKGEITQCNHSVKVYGVFSSTSQLTVSSLLFQFHLDEDRDSTGVVRAFDHDHN